MNTQDTNNLELTMNQKFNIYLEENPDVYPIFKQFAAMAKTKGFTTYSATMLVNNIRWETSINGSDDYKINNNYHPYLARKLMVEDPSFLGFFRLRRLKEDRLEDNLNYELV